MPQIAKPGKFGIQPLKEILKEMGVTHEQVADELGVRPNAVTMLCNGNAAPSLSRAAKIARFLDMPIESLFGPSVLYGEDETPAKARTRR